MRRARSARGARTRPRGCWWHGGRHPDHPSRSSPRPEPLGVVVVCEDDEATLELLCDNLTADRYDAIPAPSAADALRQCHYRSPDLLLLDIELPDASGLDVLREIRRAERTTGRYDSKLPVIVLVGPLERHRSDARAGGGRRRLRDEAVLSSRSSRRACGRSCAAATSARSGPIRVGDLAIDPSRREVTVDGDEVTLANKEYELLLTARLGSAPRLHQVRASSRYLGLPHDGPHAHARFPREPPAPKARSRRRPLHRELLGRRLPAPPGMTGEPLISALGGLAGGLWPIALSMAVVVAGGRVRDGRRRRSLNERLHELRRPLQALALAAKPPGPDRPDPLELALAALRDLDREVNGGGFEFRRRPVEARMLAIAACERWRVRAAKAGRRIAVRWRCGDVLADVDPAARLAGARQPDRERARARWRADHAGRAPPRRPDRPDRARLGRHRARRACASTRIRAAATACGSPAGSRAETAESCAFASRWPRTARRQRWSCRSRPSDRRADRPLRTGGEEPHSRRRVRRRRARVRRPVGGGRRHRRGAGRRRSVRCGPVVVTSAPLERGTVIGPQGAQRGAGRAPRARVVCAARRPGPSRARRSAESSRPRCPPGSYLTVAAFKVARPACGRGPAAGPEGHDAGRDHGDRRGRAGVEPNRPGRPRRRDRLGRLGARARARGAPTSRRRACRSSACARPRPSPGSTPTAGSRRSRSRASEALAPDPRRERRRPGAPAGG